PHGPEIYAVSSMEIIFEAFEVISKSDWPISSQFQPPKSAGLLHELLHVTDTYLTGGLVNSSHVWR
ncbi:MAG TPA: hypothetical protein VGU71_14765, partial [Candidatus Dormibacteraeota bacterium]|nr:hypothetical protein [Candidatus Dormibacteraeota bacterium]